MISRNAMYLLGHIGLTAAAVRVVDRERDLRLPILLSILPDLLDKPIDVLLPGLVNGNTRNFGHTMLGSLIALAVLFLLRRRLGNPLLLWCCCAGHLLLDRIWLASGPIIFFWPFLGRFPDRPAVGDGTPHLLLYNVIGEALGLALILGTVARARRAAWNQDAT